MMMAFSGGLLLQHCVSWGGSFLCCGGSFCAAQGCCDFVLQRI